ncbi:MAG: right-handed parallel beta-helix repeat-containing protein [Planctomycetaceae bacterium]|nr:right-handed parallel beta-helix repeat-containing protein [Planctomycetaceae bacterium]
MRNAVRFVKFKSGLLCLTLLLCGLQPAVARVIYVDNRAGNNALNGLSPKIVDGNNGPVKTIQRALDYAQQGDKIILINNKTPYYESISLSGKRFCGIGKEKFTILGNGATLNGTIKIPMNGWKQLANGLWKVTPYRKGYFNLYLDGKAVPEYQPEKEQSVKLDDIPAGNWAVHQGAIYYRGTKNQLPPTEPFSLAGKSVGLSLIDVDGVYISDLNIENFRVDGINIHDRCKNVTLEKVTCSGNGRSGLSVNGTSQVEVIDSKLINNRLDDLLVTEQGVADLKQTELSKKGAVTP